MQSRMVEKKLLPAECPRREEDSDMRRLTILMGILALAAVGLLEAGPVRADSFSIGVQTDSLRLGVNIGERPPLAVVPGTPVYHAPSLPHNYFVYRQHYYLFHDGVWFSSVHYNGPWTAIALERVPQPILAVPMNYYKAPPGHWKKKHGPPPWAQANGHGKKEHGKKKWEDDD
jgi:hypothetical protein